MIINIYQYRLYVHMDWYAQAPVTVFQLAACVFCLKNDMFVLLTTMLVNVCQYVVLSLIFQTQNRRERRFRAEELWMFFLSSHLDLIGDQNDVQSL